MCGFVGFTGLREQREAILHRMADRIIHRGPDMEGYHISTCLSMRKGNL